MWPTGQFFEEPTAETWPSTVEGELYATDVIGRLLSSLSTTNFKLVMSSEQDTSTEQSQAPTIFDSLPYYDNDLERYPILKEKVEKELAKEAKPQGIHPRVPPPPKLFAVSALFLHTV